MKKPLLIAAIVLLGAIAGALLAHPGSLPAATVTLRGAKTELPFTLADGRIEIQAAVDGKGPYPFVLDTGGQSTVLSSSLADELGLPELMEAMVAGPGGAALPGRVVKVDRVDLADASVTGLTVVAFDMSRLFVKPNPPRGILSGKMFAGLLLTLDYAAQRIGLEKGGLPAADGVEVLDYDPASPLITVTASVVGRSMALDIDTGSSHGILMPQAYAKDLPLSAPTGAKEHVRSVNGESDATVRKLKGELRLGGQRITDPDIAFLPDIQRASIGYAYLKGFTISVDAQNHRIRFARPAGGASQ